MYFISLSPEEQGRISKRTAADKKWIALAWK
jgi:hypothetical protein